MRECCYQRVTLPWYTLVDVNVHHRIMAYAYDIGFHAKEGTCLGNTLMRSDRWNWEHCLGEEGGRVIGEGDRGGEAFRGVIGFPRRGERSSE
jgi:hypothetical protein